MTRPIELAAGDLQLSFRWLGDRYAHRVISGATDEQFIWESLEGTDNSPWPPSPPLQQVHVESRPGGSVVALAVGMSGRSHWSVSFELAADGASLAVDAACRCMERPVQLGSRYRASAQPAGWRWMVDDPTELVDKQRDDGSTELIVSPAMAAVPYPATIRWQYRIQRQRR